MIFYGFKRGIFTIKTIRHPLKTNLTPLFSSKHVRFAIDACHIPDEVDLSLII
jgi:hypothetical protein